MTARSIQSRVGQSAELSSIRTSASYWGVRAANDYDVDVFGVHGSVHPLQLLDHLINPKQKLARMLTEFHLHRVEIHGEAASLLETAGAVVLHEPRPCCSGRLSALDDVERNSLARGYQ